MQLSVEISKYPLNENYIPAIQGFIDRLNTHKSITVLTNTMSTQVFGDFDDVMKLIKKSYGKDEEGDRREFYKLVEKTELISR